MLYENISVNSDGVARLARTLLDRPELALRTVELELFTEVGKYRANAEDLALHPDIVARIQRPRTKRSRLGFNVRADRFVTEVILVLLPTFQRLRKLAMHIDSQFEFFKMQAQYPELTTLGLHCVYGFRALWLNTKLVQWLKGRAPKLQVLYMKNVETCSVHLADRIKTLTHLQFSGPLAGLSRCQHAYPNHKSLENITLLDIEENNMTRHGNSTIIHCCVNLEHFRLAFTDPEKVILPNLAKDLWFRRTTLRSIKIDPLDPKRDPLPNKGKAITTLQSFTQLETLRIPATFFFVNDDEEAALDFLLSLPPSMKNLEVYRDHGDIGLVLKEFQGKVDHKKFPRFERLHILDEWPDMFKDVEEFD